MRNHEKDVFVKSPNSESLQCKRASCASLLSLWLRALQDSGAFYETIKLGLFGNSSRIGRDRNQKEEGI